MGKQTSSCTARVVFIDDHCYIWLFANEFAKLDEINIF